MRAVKALQGLLCHRVIAANIYIFPAATLHKPNFPIYILCHFRDSMCVSTMMILFPILKPQSSLTKNYLLSLVTKKNNASKPHATKPTAAY